MQAVPDDLAIAANDAEAARLFEAGIRMVGLSGGDLCHTMGGRGDVADRRGLECVVCPVDVGRVELDGVAHVFVAHVVVVDRLGLWPRAALMNAEWWSRRRLGPRSHPGDGLLDVTTGRLGARESLHARRRSQTGDHLPHPSLTMRRVAEVELTFERPRRVEVDGIAAGAARRVVAGFEADQLLVVV